MAYHSIFDYYLNDSDWIMVKASCDDIGAAPLNLKVELPKNFKTTNKNVVRGIEDMAIFNLKQEKALELKHKEGVK